MTEASWVQVQLQRLPEYEAQLETVAGRLESAEREGQRLMEQVSTHPRAQIRMAPRCVG